MKQLVAASLVIVGIGAAFLFFSKPTHAPQDTPALSASVSEPMTKSESLPEEFPAKRGAVTATISTAKGDIVASLYPAVAPKTVENFVKLAGQGFYDGTAFHRVVSGFVIQGGDPLSKDNDPSNDGTGGPGYTFEDEINPRALGLSDAQIVQYEARGYHYRDDLQSLSMQVGVIAMANSGPSTNGSQFFIVTDKDQLHLNGLHTVFGEVVSGLDVAHEISVGDRILSIRTGQ